jgi:transcriptional regulator with XRE-family HTH domain
MKKHKDIHPVIHYILRESRLSKREIASRLKITAQGLAAWENGLVRIKDYMIDDLCAAAEVLKANIPIVFIKRHEDIRDKQINKALSIGAKANANSAPAPPSVPQRVIKPVERWPDGVLKYKADGKTLSRHHIYNPYGKDGKPINNVDDLI